MSDKFSFEERQNTIISLLARKGRLSVAEIVEQFQVSEATARRDLEILADQGRLQRVYGGALPVTQALPEPPILQREQEQTFEKRRIGQTAADLVHDGETILYNRFCCSEGIYCRPGAEWDQRSHCLI